MHCQHLLHGAIPASPDPLSRPPQSTITTLTNVLWPIAKRHNLNLPHGIITAVLYGHYE
ncbi:hypothetical protein H3S83_11140 [Bartonella sp. W8122]|uniref:hypothetical protein n=1 Tax=Bartonella TaxID=773 RepID=UPI0018DB61AC|nr:MULTISPECIES: hypothetical protein [Bartonella]MBI0002378.1 hypothetical protein [Bartonella sp. W8122]MBI0021663.1 hypothetical protein [Bartonella apihabitans]